MGDTTQGVPPAALIDHPNPSTTVNASIFSMLAVSTAFLAVRIYCKMIHTRRVLWADDYLLLAGWVVNVLSHALTSKIMALGFGRSLSVTPMTSAILYAADNCHKVALGLTKTSFAVTLLRISVGWQVYLIWFLVASMNIQFVVHIVLTWRATCGDPTAAETPHLPGPCWATESAIALGLFGGFYSAISDFILALLPWKIIMGLNMKKAEKIGVATAMSIGILAGVTGIMKAVWSIILLDFQRRDYPWQMAMFWIWCQAEPNATIIAASIPSFRVLVRSARSTHDRAYAYNSNMYIKSDNMSKFHNGHQGAAFETAVGTDTGSDRSGLALGPGDGSAGHRARGITRTREVRVEHSRAELSSYRSMEDIELSDGWPLGEGQRNN